MIQALQQPFHPSSSLPLLTLLHAIRVSIGWAQLSSSKDRLNHLAGFWTMAFGGSTLASLLLNQPPPWLTSYSIPLVYTLTYLLLQPILPTLLSTLPSFPLNLTLTLFDAVNRSFTLSSVLHSLSTHPNQSFQNNLLTSSLIAAVAVSGGGILVSLFGLDKDDWKFATPAVLRSNGKTWLNTMDLWSAALGITLLDFLRRTQPNEFKMSGDEEKRWIGAFLAGCLMLRMILLRQSSSLPKALKEKTPARQETAVSESISEPSPTDQPLVSISTPAPTEPVRDRIETPSPPAVHHKDFFQPGEPLSAGRKKTLEIRNKEWMRRTEDGGDQPPLPPARSLSDWMRQRRKSKPTK